MSTGLHLGTCSFDVYLDCRKLVSRGDVVELGYTLVLETSASEHESSNLSIPTKGFMETWPSGLRRRTAKAECPERHHPFESDRLRHDCIALLLAARLRKLSVEEPVF